MEAVGETVVGASPLLPDDPPAHERPPHPAAAGSEASSDNESWTILDEEDEEDRAVVAAAAAAAEVSGGAWREGADGVSPAPAVQTEAMAGSSSAAGCCCSGESDSDIETLEKGFFCETRSNLQPFSAAATSAQDDHEVETPSEFSEEPESGDEDDEDDEDDIEQLLLLPKINDLTSQQYPTEELPEEFAEAMIKRGRTYSHQRNQDVNVVLTGVLIVVVAMVLGLGVGHFLGWSERLELQEYYAEVREEKMEELAENLVTCMTGEEGKGGDDQDLDDKVIQQLWVENKELKEQLEVLKNHQALDDSSRKIESELNVILRDRINDLLAANADLEKEVTRLRFSQSAVLDEKLEEARSHLQQTRQNLNEITHENEQLKIAIAKARYSTPSMPIVEKARLNDLQTENEELKHEIRRFRYLPLPHVEPKTAEVRREESPPSSDIDEGFVDLDSDDVQAVAAGAPFLDEDDERHVVAAAVEAEEDPVALQQPEERKQHLPSAPLGDLFESAAPLPVTELGSDEGTENVLVTESGDLPAPVGGSRKEGRSKQDAESFASLFHKLSDLVINSTNTLFNKQGLFDLSSMVKAIGKVNKKAQKIIKQDVLSEENLKKVTDFAAVAEDVLISKWKEVQTLAEGENLQKHAETTKVAMNSLGKTLVATLHNIKDSLKKDNLEESWGKIHGFLQTKWQSVLDKFQSRVRKSKAKSEEPPQSKAATEKTAAADLAGDNDVDDIVVVERPTQQQSSSSSSEYSQFSAPPPENGTSWIFQRALDRQKSRKDALRSDWLFNRAKDRERFHDVSKAEWHSKRLFSRRCFQDDEGEEHCEDIGQLNPAEVHRISQRRKKGETEEVEHELPKFRSKFLYANLGDDEDEGIRRRRGAQAATFESFGVFDDDDDEDEDEEGEEEEEDWIRPIHMIQKHNRRHHHQGQGGERWFDDAGHRRSSRQDKRSRYQHSSSRSDHHHYRKNSRPKQHSFSFET